ncbi:hypothetical protein CSUI_006262, partial [Cystoisospora suis]
EHLRSHSLYVLVHCFNDGKYSGICELLYSSFTCRFLILALRGPHFLSGSSAVCRTSYRRGSLYEELRIELSFSRALCRLLR